MVSFSKGPQSVRDVAVRIVVQIPKFVKSRCLISIQHCFMKITETQILFDPINLDHPNIIITIDEKNKSELILHHIISCALTIVLTTQFPN
jgi:hypothetical protein